MCVIGILHEHALSLSLSLLGELFPGKGGEERGGGGEMGREGRGREISSDFEQVSRLSKQWPRHGKVS